ncbi:hypothetical protein BT96DRAFT_864541 [Gymnopus androsaceus JB14]|uniref:Uncharacterized protein n=1 Tax=Gymnopus androsaceus JB14 TaxID=1447944 RepID=A0A6A4H2T4_9AGAR|nr:hypothetical protein BT96DRAFT_864541 [Gymnopus androsaceus JB14]
MSTTKPISLTEASRNSGPCYRFVPQVGSYISFSLDINDETEEVMQTFSVKKYVALIQDLLDLPLPERSYHRTGLRLLQQGIPDPIPELCVEPHMCFPVFPEKSHPLNCPPVKTDKQLPWEGYYHLSCLDATVCLPQSHLDYVNAVKMDHDDWLRTNVYCRQDIGLVRANQAKASPVEQGENSGLLEPSIRSHGSGRERKQNLGYSESEVDVYIDSDSSPSLQLAAQDVKQHKYYEDGEIDWLAEFDDDEPYSESLNEHQCSDAQSESDRWFSEGEEEEPSAIDNSQDDMISIPRMNTILEALLPFSGDTDDGSFLPVVQFYPEFRSFTAFRSFIKTLTPWKRHTANHYASAMLKHNVK